jgi:hypothetical protein
LQVTFEEGTWAGWLYDLLKPHVTELLVLIRERLLQSCKGRVADKPLVIRMPKDGCVQLSVACRKSNMVAHRNQ